MGEVISLLSSKQAQKIAEKTFWKFVNSAYAGDFSLQSTDEKTGVEVYLVASETPEDTEIMHCNSLKFSPGFFDNTPRFALALTEDRGALVMQIANTRFFQFIPVELAIILEPFARSHFTRVVSPEQAADNP